MPKFEDLATYIEAAWKTQGALARELGVAQNTVSQWVNRKLRVTLEYQTALRNLTPPYDGPFPDTGTDGIKDEQLRALALQEQARYEDLRGLVVALGAAVQELLRRVPPPPEK